MTFILLWYEVNTTKKNYRSSAEKNLYICFTSKVVIENNKTEIWT